jgi:hypothetical protein
MKWFWWSLLGFCVLMCGCRTKKVDASVATYERNVASSDVNVATSMIDTFRVLRMGIDQSKLTIKETIINRKYDKDTGNLTEETETEREIAQDSDKVVAEEGIEGVTEENHILLKHESDFSKMEESDVKEESIGGQSMFGKWFGIGLALIISFLFLYLLKKLRVN